MHDFATVKAAARGRWCDILPALGIPAEALTNRHRPCPGCGGTDRFRFDDKDGNGTWFCSGGGEPRSGDGFALLAHVRGLLPFDALLAVAGYLGLEGRQEGRARGRERAGAASVATVEAALVHELRVLLIVVSNRVNSRQLAADSKFRVLRPEWQPMPEGHWERELLAVHRIRNGLEVLYARG